MFPSTNPAMQDAIQAAVRPIERTFETSTIPAISRGAQAGQASGGSRQGIAEGIAAENKQNLVGDVSARVASQGFGQGLDAATRALAFGPQTTGLSFLPSSAVEAVGSQQQGLQQQFQSESQQRFMLEQMLPFLIAQDVAGIAFGQPTGATSTTSIPGLSGAQAGFGGAGLGAALAPLLGFGAGGGAGVGALAGLALL